MATPNEKVLAGFADYLKVEKGLARLSVSAYLRDLRQFAVTLESQKPSRSLLRARGDDVRYFLKEYLSKEYETRAGLRKKFDGRSVARKLSALRHFYKYLLLDKLID